MLESRFGSGTYLSGGTVSDCASPGRASNAVDAVGRV